VKVSARLAHSVGKLVAQIIFNALAALVWGCRLENLDDRNGDCSGAIAADRTVLDHASAPDRHGRASCSTEMQRS
jgi:hypothetical protein